MMGKFDKQCNNYLMIFVKLFLVNISGHMVVGIYSFQVENFKFNEMLY